MYYSLDKIEEEVMDCVGESASGNYSLVLFQIVLNSLSSVTKQHLNIYRQTDRRIRAANIAYKNILSSWKIE